jgi:hypothetical protein
MSATIEPNAARPQCWARVSDSAAVSPFAPRRTIYRRCAVPRAHARLHCNHHPTISTPAMAKHDGSGTGGGEGSGMKPGPSTVNSPMTNWGDGGSDSPEEPSGGNAGS